MWESNVISNTLHNETATNELPPLQGGLQRTQKASTPTLNILRSQRCCKFSKYTSNDHLSTILCHSCKSSNEF